MTAPITLRQEDEDLAAYLAVDIPDPREVAEVMALHYPLLARALLNAQRCRNGNLYAREYVAELRSYSMTDIRTPFLTAYGQQVRRALVWHKKGRTGV